MNGSTETTDPYLQLPIPKRAWINNSPGSYWRKDGIYPYTATHITNYSDLGKRFCKLLSFWKWRILPSVKICEHDQPQTWPDAHKLCGAWPLRVHASLCSTFLWHGAKNCHQQARIRMFRSADRHYSGQRVAERRINQYGADCLRTQLGILTIDQLRALTEILPRVLFLIVTK